MGTALSVALFSPQNFYTVKFQDMINTPVLNLLSANLKNGQTCSTNSLTADDDLLECISPSCEVGT